MSSARKIILKSSDGEYFEVDKAVAQQSQILTYVIEDCADNYIPLPNVNSEILPKVIEYCKKHVEAQENPAFPDDDLQAWDVKFVKVDQATLCDLILAANYLNIKSLLDLTSQTLGDMVRGQTPEELRKKFNIKNDFTPDEEEEVRRENQWAFDKRVDETEWEVRERESEDARVREWQARMREWDLRREHPWAFVGDNNSWEFREWEDLWPVDGDLYIDLHQEMGEGWQGGL